MSAAEALPVPQSASAEALASDVLSELQFVAPLAKVQSRVPVLSTVLVRIADGEINFVATDLDVTSHARCRARTTESAAVAVAARQFVAAVRSFAVDRYAEIRVVIDASGLTLSSGTASLTLHGTPAEDFPRVSPRPVLSTPMIISGEVFRKALARVAFAITHEETRFQLDGALLETTKKNGTTLVATDGHRMAFVAVPCTGGNRPARTFIRRSALVQLSRCRALDVAVEAIGPDVALVAGDRVTLTRNIDNVNFPDWRGVVPDIPPVRPASTSTAWRSCVPFAAPVSWRIRGRERYGWTRLMVSSRCRPSGAPKAASLLSASRLITAAPMSSPACVRRTSTTFSQRRPTLRQSVYGFETKRASPR